MTLQTIVNEVRHNRLPNITNRKQLSDEWIIYSINETLRAMHSSFLIRKEQAMIVVPRFKDTFILDNTDPNVVMGTYNRIAFAKAKEEKVLGHNIEDQLTIDGGHINHPNNHYHGGYKHYDHSLHGHRTHHHWECHPHDKRVDAFILDELKRLKGPSEEIEVHDVFSNTLAEYEGIVQPDLLLGLDDDYSDYSSDMLLEILEVWDEDGTEYTLNEENVFSINQNSLYFPNAKEGQVIYVVYKPKPKVYTLDDLAKDKSVEIDLPETLMQCLYASIDLRMINTIDGYATLYPAILNNYEKEVQNVRLIQLTLPDEMNTTLNKKKGFY